ncbi:hypothetical protein LIHA111178_08220 [Litorimonas haliclonae]
MYVTRQKMDYHKIKAENIGKRLQFIEGALIVMLAIFFSNIGIRYFGGNYPEWVIVLGGALLGGLIGSTVPKPILKSYHKRMNVRYLRKYLAMENLLTGTSNDNAE